VTLNKTTNYVLIFLISLYVVFQAGGCKKDSSNPAGNNNGDPQQYGTPFSGVPDLKDIILYEVNERAYSTEGNLAGVTKRLDSLKELGINTIWLMPLHPIGQLHSSGGLGSPYSVKDYLDVNPEFGTLQNLRDLVSAAHNRGIAVIMDWVANHTAWDNPWITNKSWYTQDTNGNIIIPPGTNWQDVADLNYSNTDMRTAMIKAMKYWILTANVDGFRCDASDMVPADFWQQALDAIKKIPGRKFIFLSEGVNVDGLNAGFQMNYGWDFYHKLQQVYNSGYSAVNLYTTHIVEYHELPAWKEKLRFITNHDECAWNNTPLAYFGGKKGSIAAFVASVFVGGIPLVYNGQEVGCPFKIPFFTKSPIDWTINYDMTVEYKRILNFRKTSQAVKRGDLTNYENDYVFTFKRIFDYEKVLVIVNLLNSSIQYTLPAAIANTNWKNALTSQDVSLGTSLSLQPYDYLILRNN